LKRVKCIQTKRAGTPIQRTPSCVEQTSYRQCHSVRNQQKPSINQKD
jgi:hypothetical protein